MYVCGEVEVLSGVCVFVVSAGCSVLFCLVAVLRRERVVVYVMGGR